MIINLTRLLLCVGAATLIGIGFYLFSNEQNKEVVSISSIFLSSICLSTIGSLTISDNREDTNIKLSAFIVFILSLIASIIFALFEFNIYIYVLFLGLLITFLLFAFSLIRN